MLQQEELTFREKMTAFFDQATLRIPAGAFWTSACSIILIAVVVTLGMAERKSVEGASTNMIPPVTPQAKPAAKAPAELGDVRPARAVYGGNKVILATDGTALDDMATALPEARQALASRLVAQGRAFEIDNHAKVLVVGFGFGEVKVRVMEGTNRDRTGWAPIEAVQ
jgi:hypothetical protein